MLALTHLKIGKNTVEIKTKTGGMLLTNRTYFVDDAIRHFRLPRVRQVCK